MTDLEIKVSNSLDTLHKALNNLEPAIVHVQSVVKATEAVKLIIDENISFLNSQKDLNKEHKVQLVSSLNKGIDSISKKSYEVLDGVKSSTEDIITLDKSINDYLLAIKKIDFPTRLTSIEADISSVSSAFNNIQGTISTIQNEIIRLERENSTKINLVNENLNSNHQLTVEKIEQVVKENKTLKIIMITTAVLSLISIVTNFFNS
ncbi:hypothetical protein [Polaribacter dokdonensis]|uniref:Uncharacterized protein n=1 Tax=Polaribacter dokdonensis DSW-5 TaxID=1300348 RepID=A0A0M9CGH2_9FLAO|nr:hypothetical protein [Polaribacter dokdonensis]KOY51936.1 hypothetical protein I602_1496 [Polaribacter dokdonensis DSW-5]SED99487.1 hypothetical protein SAMN05444353_0271 [Polaribacter dokdonensis DSW-5]